MSIQSSDIKCRLSGGASNADPAASLGGVKSGTDISLSLFANETVAQVAAGNTMYRCFYVHNAHATLTAQNAVAWLNSNTPSSLTDVNIGLGTSALNGTEQAVASETTAPAGISWLAAASKGAGVALGDIPPGQSRAVWLRRITTAGTLSAPVADPFTVRVEVDSV